MQVVTQGPHTRRRSLIIASDFLLSSSVYALCNYDVLGHYLIAVYIYDVALGHGHGLRLCS